jgi:hypothetical protein
MINFEEILYKIHKYGSYVTPYINYVLEKHKNEEIAIFVHMAMLRRNNLHEQTIHTINHDLFNPNKEEVQDLKDRYRKGKVGDVEVKEKLAIALNNFLDPFRERRQKYETSGMVEELIVRGTEQVREEVRNTVLEMKKLMGLSGVYMRIRRKAERYLKKQDK